MILSLPILEKNYKIEMKIGSGGMGDVYLATDKRLDRPVAIKILKLKEIGSYELENFVEKFQVEAKSIAKLMHPNIVSIYDFGDEDSQYYMIMEYLEGKTLSKVVHDTNQKFPASMIASIAFQVCNALEYVHENKIIHRDIKPDNIILSKKGIVKLTDFGIAKMNYDKVIENNELPDLVLGSIIYSSPEQIKDASSIDHRADIYSLGITLYELVSGRTPFGSSNVSDVITKIFTEEPRSLKIFSPDLPDLLNNIIVKAIAKDPMMRFQNAKEMKEALMPLLEKEVIESKSYSNLENLSNSTSIDIKNNPIAESSNRNTLLLKNTLFNKEKESLKLTNNISEINPNLTVTLTKMSDVIKNFSWISSIIHNWKSISINTNKTRQVIESLTERSIYGKSFTGVCIFNKNTFIFLYDGYIVGALDSLNKKVGDNVISSLPDICENIEAKSNDIEDDYSSIILYNLATYGNKIISDLEPETTDLLGVIDHLSFDEDFTGYIVCSSKSLKKSKTYNILHVEDDKIAQV
ncbi:MAG: serine/threonine protein kinase, partial [Candidatus Sericytochromatia bacterium]|nr:serine/threonine protein kinase [Candidatus Sericytochromatia bacterium]